MHYYAISDLLPRERLRFAAMGLLVMGFGLWTGRRGRGHDGVTGGAWAAGIWPLWILVPALVLLSLLPSKVPWIIAVLFPAWATLQAVGVSRMCDGTWAACHGQLSRGVVSVAIVVLAALMVWPLIGRDYEETLKRVDKGQWRGADYSREIARVMNRTVADGDRVLMTSFYYWSQIPAGHACAVFAYYFTRDAAVLVRSHEESFEHLLSDIREYKLDRALLSPPPGAKADEVFGGFMGELGLEPIKLRTAYIFDTRSLLDPRD